MGRSGEISAWPWIAIIGVLNLVLATNVLFLPSRVVRTGAGHCGPCGNTALAGEFTADANIMFRPKNGPITGKMNVVRGWLIKARRDYILRSTIIFLISTIALAGFRPLGQAFVQL